MPSKNQLLQCMRASVCYSAILKLRPRSDHRYSYYYLYTYVSDWLFIDCNLCIKLAIVRFENRFANQQCDISELAAAINDVI